MMARRKKSSRGRLLVGLTLAVVVLAMGWLALPHIRQHWLHSGATGPVAADHVDPANEGRTITLKGKLEITSAALDTQLAISADAAILFRHVEMYQWLEHCDGADCRYDAQWSADVVDSHKFRVPAGHENPAFPFAGAVFAAEGIRLGAFGIDRHLVQAQIAAVDYPVHASALPANLAVTFRDADGVLYAGGDPAHPTVGAVRVSFLAVSLGMANLTGVQRGGRLVAN
jgi:hypothetical protein